MKVSLVLCAVVFIAVAQAKFIRHQNKVSGSYIIRFKSTAQYGYANGVGRMLKNKGKEIKELKAVRTMTVKGHLSWRDIANLEADPNVEFIEEDGEVHAAFGGCSSYREGVPWGLDSLDGRQDNTFNINDAIARTNDVVIAYVLDTGVLDSHPDFQGRVGHVYNAFTSGADQDPNDQNGHGTHCAGTIAGFFHGVAKRAFIMNGKVLSRSGSGSYAGIIGGINAVIEHHRERETRHGYAKSVISMSLGGGKSTSVNIACDDAVAAGITTVVAAGNSNADSNNYSPASADSVICVGATDSNNKIASFSNWGTAVDIMAPGVSVKSAWHTGRKRRSLSPAGIDYSAVKSRGLRNDDPSLNFNPSAPLPEPSLSGMPTNTISGTSMACPHVAGVVAAELLRHEGAPPTPAKMLELLINNARSGVIDMDGRRNTVNELLQASQC